jgi:outer membrane lipoprotein carrier protein
MKPLITTIILALSMYAEIIDYKTFKSDFTQTITNPSGKTISYSGNIVANNENMYIWRYNKPIIKEVYIIQSDVIINEPELEQTIYTTLDSQINLFELIKKAKKVSKYEYISNFNEVEYGLYFKNDLLQSIAYKDEIDNKVNIIFKNQQINQNIDSKTFLFDQNPDFDIIKR